MADFNQEHEGLMTSQDDSLPADNTQGGMLSNLPKWIYVLYKTLCRVIFEYVFNPKVHPRAVFFHFLFRTLAIVSYLLCNWFSDYFVLNFVVIVLFLSFDFWTVKNVSGRLLVGLRWWNHVKNDGTSHWIFECRKDTSKINSTESSLFWWSLYGYPVLWFFFFIAGVLGFHLAWLIIVVVALVLNGANVYGYSRCQKDSQSRLRSFAGNFLAQHVLSQAMAGSSQA